MPIERRDFLRLTAAGATGLVLSRSHRAHAAWPSSGSMAINPSISNLRVIGLVDPAMLPTKPSSTSFADENAAVDAAKVAANLDLMAMWLTQRCTADEAWQTIFRSSKPWSSTVVAIKVNAAEPKNSPRVAVVDKIARVLNGFGVPAANISIYDRAAVNSYSSYCSRTDTSKTPAVIDMNMGGQVDTPLPDGTTAPCAKKIADGTVDILVNVGVNKGHEAFGGATLCLKSHFGTFAPNHFCPPSDAGNFCSNPDTAKFYNYIFTISKSDAIIGGAPPRQQLCIVDSIIANKKTNTGDPESMPCYLVMGTFGPAVDYLTIKKIREEVMGATHNATVTNMYMTQYGYTANDPQWIEVDPAAGPPADCGNTGSSSPGVGGAAGGGASGSSGAGSGGRVGAGGSGAGGAPASGGSPGSGGVSASGGAPGSGGVVGSDSGGTLGSGGATPSAASGSGGATPATTTVGSTSGGKACGCDLGGASRARGRWAALLAIGAVAAGQLRRLALRPEMLARSAPPETQAGTSATEEQKE
jgi:uncharacterized membrane protein YgcG